MFELSVCLDRPARTSGPSNADAGQTDVFHVAKAAQSIDVTAGTLRILGFGRVRERAADPVSDGSSREDAGALIGRLWRTHGRAFADHLAGEFAVVVCDHGSGEVVAAVDRFATYPLFFAQRDRRLAIGHDPKQVATHLGLGLEIEPAAVLAYCYFHVIPAPLSIIRGVSRLDIGGRLILNRDGRLEQSCWIPHFEEHNAFDFAREKDAFLSALGQGVDECALGVSNEQIGCFLSGGTDSSTIAGMLSRRRGTGAKTFSIAFGVEGYDESYYSRLAAKHFGTRHTEHVLTPEDAARAVATVARRYEQPFGNSSAVPTFICAELAAQQGVTRLLGGDGGDELYGGNERYAKQWLFGLYDGLPGVLQSPLEGLLFGPLAQSKAKLFSKARGYIDQAKIPLPDRLQAKYNLLERFGRAEVLSAELLGRVKDHLPEQMAREVYGRSEARAQINRLLAFDFKYTLGDNDLPKVTRMCHAAGVEVSFPMLADPVVEHSLRLIPDQKLRRTYLRFFFKNSLRGFLPDEIIEKSKHGFGMPFGDWLITRPEMQAMADDALASLASRGFIRAPFVELLRNEVRAGHAGYFGTMVWVLMTLELWLREHLPTARL